MEMTPEENRRLKYAKNLLENPGFAAKLTNVIGIIATIASRFGATVSQKAAASAVPVIGAVGGALINSIFMDHFQNMARGHFIMRSLERKYAGNIVKFQFCMCIYE